MYKFLSINKFNLYVFPNYIPTFVKQYNIYQYIDTYIIAFKIYVLEIVLL